jgi:23S rRNA (adenine1618-N6)-methyltransferase
MHPNNPHQGEYPMAELLQALPELQQFTRLGKRGQTTIDFTHADAVLCLNRALLKHYYQIDHWQIPAGYLCPPIPGRADYVHSLADIIAELDWPKPVTVLDIGTGANLIYPILAARSFRWRAIGADIDPVAVASAKAIVDANPILRGKIDIRQQPGKGILRGIIKNGEKIHATLCNPPFYRDAAEAERHNQRKWKNLGQKTGQRNFGGQHNELWCDGGEAQFLRQMIDESVEFAGQVGWFTSLVASHKNIPALQGRLKDVNAAEVRVVEMAQGQKRSRLIAWRF